MQIKRKTLSNIRLLQSIDFSGNLYKSKAVKKGGKKDHFKVKTEHNGLSAVLQQAC